MFFKNTLVNNFIKNLFLIFILSSFILCTDVKASITEKAIWASLELPELNERQRLILQQELKVYTKEMDALAKTDLLEWKKKTKELLVKISNGFRIYKLARDPETNRVIHKFEQDSGVNVYILTHIEDVFLNNVFYRIAEAYYEISRPQTYVMFKFKFIRAVNYTDENPCFQKKELSKETTKDIDSLIDERIIQANISADLPTNKSFSSDQLNLGYVKCVTNLMEWMETLGLKGAATEIKITSQDINEEGIDEIAFKVSTHQRIAKNAAKSLFWSEDKIKLLIRGVAYTDESSDAGLVDNSSYLHFDNLNSFLAIKNNYDYIQDNIKRVIGSKTATEFHLGFYIHAIQDFYAHSNYTELLVDIILNSPDKRQGLKDIPTFAEVLNNKASNSNFRSLLENNLHSGQFNLFAEIFGESGDNIFGYDYEKTHAYLNKDNADTKIGIIAEKLAEKETKEILVIFSQNRYK